MKPITSLLAVVLIALAWAPLLPAQAVAELTAVTTKFQTAYDRDVAKPHLAAVAALDARYLGAVTRALDAATQAGNLDEAIKLRAEIQRLNSKEPLPPVDLDSLPASLKKLRTTYREALAKLENDRAVKAQPYYDHYDKLLETLQVDLTKQQRIDDAITVKTQRPSL